MNGSRRRAARIAGLLYLLAGVSGGFGILYVPQAVTVPGDPAATVQKLLAAETLFRAGIVSELFSGVAFLLLAVALHRLFREVDGIHALRLVLLLSASAVVGFVNVIPEIAALLLARGGDGLGGLDAAQRAALVALSLEVHRYGFIVAQVFWGLWLWPFGILVMRSGFLPRILGVLLLANGVGYLVLGGVTLLAPRHADLAALLTMLPIVSGELSIVGWLLVKGADERAPDAASG